MEFLNSFFNYFYDLFFSLFGERKAKGLILGLDNAGKTSLLHKLTKGMMFQVIPTQRVTSETVCIHNLTLQLLDLGGHTQVRKMWNDYFESADFVIFMVDSADFNRVQEARTELNKVIQMLPQAPVLVLGNKCDMKFSLSKKELLEELELQNLTTDEVQWNRIKELDPDQTVDTVKKAEFLHWEKQGQYLPNGRVAFFMSSLVSETGYQDGLKWLSSVL